MQRAMKWFLGLLASAAFLCGGFVVLHGSLPPASINAWLPAGSLTAARTGAASVLLQDGRLLITGGNGASGVLATTDILNPSSGFTPGPPMNLARSSHVAVVLLDGRVLVAGGTDASGRASQSAELFDPAANSWSASGPLMVGRSGATATLLPSGRCSSQAARPMARRSPALSFLTPTRTPFRLSRACFPRRVRTTPPRCFPTAACSSPAAGTAPPTPSPAMPTFLLPLTFSIPRPAQSLPGGARRPAHELHRHRGA